MRLGIRIFLVYFLFVGLAGYFLLNTVREQIRPVVRQSSEETLVDTANLLAEILHDDVKAGTLNQGRLPEVLKAYGSRSPGAQIWGWRRTRSATASMSPTPRASCCWTPAVRTRARTIRSGTMCC